MKVLLAGGLVLLVGPVVGLAVLLGSQAGATAESSAAAPLCVTSGPVEGLDPGQAGHARAIVSTAQQVTTEAGFGAADQARAELIALMTAATESTLHNYANPAAPESQALPSDGNPPTGGDLDSVGLFQQRASWGPVSARMDPQASTRLFIERLVRIPAWSTIPPGVAAQAVQVSAYPDRYSEWQAAATQWLAIIDGLAPAAPGVSAPVTTMSQCGSDGLAIAPGSPQSGIPPMGYTIPADATDAARIVVTYALAQLGKPYVFGAAGPDAYDCSGLTMAAWGAAGVHLAHFTGSQFASGQPVGSTALLSPGDLIFIPGADGTLRDPGHVGMFIADGLVVEAPQTGDVVKIVPLSEFQPIAGMRHIG